MMLQATKALPPEIWSQVLDYVPQIVLQYLLSVCSLLHDLAVCRIFASIKIYLIGGEKGMRMLNTFHLDWTHDTAGKLMRKSWEILNRVSKDPQFAKVVKHMTVIAYAEVTMANTFSFLPNLQTFSWIGCYPALDDEIAQCLPSTLQKLDVRSTLPLHSLQHLTQITTLHLPVPFLFPDDDEAVDRLVEDIFLTDLCSTVPIEQVFDVFPSTLQSLRICASHIINIPIRLYSTLRELEIFGTIGDEREFIGLDAMFRHAICLESLDVVGYIHPIFFTFLPHTSSGDLQKLTSFRLSIEALFTMGEEELYALTGFLYNRHSLRRLYLRHPEMQSRETLRVLQVIAELKGLEVLGVHTGCDVFVTRESLNTIANALSANLRALHLAINWGGDDLLPLMDRIGKFPKLTFLHLYGIVTRLPISVEELATEAKGLDTIGLNRALWSVERVGPEISTTKWPRWKIKFCVEDEFVTPDDYWLFKYN